MVVIPSEAEGPLFPGRTFQPEESFDSASADPQTQRAEKAKRTLRSG
jgi:hypothetical protein